MTIIQAFIEFPTIHCGLCRSATFQPPGIYANAQRLAIMLLPERGPSNNYKLVDVPDEATLLKVAHAAGWTTITYRSPGEDYDRTVTMCPACQLLCDELSRYRL
jgi:hypothetical protein